MSYVYPHNQMHGGPPPGGHAHPHPVHVTNSAPPPGPPHDYGRGHSGSQYPLPPSTQIQPTVNSLASGMHHMSIHPPPPPTGGSVPYQPTGPPHQPTGPSHQPTGPPHSGQWGSLQPPKTVPHSTVGGTAGQVSSGQFSSGHFPPPPSQPTASYNPNIRMPPPPSSGHLQPLPGQPLSSGQPLHPSPGQPLSSGQPLHPSPGQPLSSGHVSSGPALRPGLLPTPPTSGQGLLPPPPSSGQGLLPPPPVSGQGILPTPPLGQGGLLPPPTTRPLHAGQGLLPSPGQRPLPPPTMRYPPPASGVTSSGQAPPGVAHGPPGSGHLPSQPMGQGSSVAPPPPTSYPDTAARPPPPPPPPTTGGMLGQAPPPPPPTSSVAPPHSHGAHPPHSHGAHPHQPHPPQPHSTPAPTATDPQLRPVNIMETRQVMPPAPVIPPKIVLPGGLGVFSPPPDIMCCTMNAIPTTSGLLGKMKLPLAIHIHPYKDVTIQECPVVHPSTIVRCRVCRAYISPFVVFIDSRHWRCNLCFRPNALPEDFDYNAQTGKRGDKSLRMELKRSSVEYIASSEYMLRPPQPCVYFFIIDVSYNSVQSGVLALTCRSLLDCLGRLPGDARTMIGFLTVDSSLHFYNLSVGNSQPQMMVVSDIDDVFLPSPDSLLVNLKESKDLVRTLLEDLPGMFAGSTITQSALGAALQVSERLLHAIGGRVTVVQACMPTTGPGALKNRDVNPPATKKDTLNMAPASDFYKKLALELSSQQIAVDLFTFSPSSQLLDLTTLSCVSRFSAGQIFYYPDFHHSQPLSRERFEKDFTRYLTRKIGFEAVMRVRCTEGISLHTFHGNFFVRSTDLLSLPNTNPDHGYTINLSIDENLKDMSTICCQAALLYTSSRGERRIRVHTLCLPVTSQPTVLYSKLNVTAITGVLANMAVDRATSASIGDARDALLNTVVDSTKTYRSQVASANSPPFTLPSSLSQLPLLILSLLKNPAFTLNSKISFDVRAHAMNLIKSTPLYYLMPTIYPHLYALHTLTEQNVVVSESGQEMVQAPLLQLSAENTSRYGIFLLDCGHSMYIWVSNDAPDQLISKMLGINNFEAIPEDMNTIPVQENECSKVVNMLIKQIRNSRQHPVSLLVIRERGHKRLLFVERLLDSKTEDGTSYYEFISHIQRQLGK